MRRILFIALLTFVTSSVQAQVHKHAIGLRGGAGDFGIGGELSYQYGFSENHRLEIDLGWNTRGSKSSYDVFAATGIYHWVWSLASGLNWYVGPGGQVAYKNFKNASDYSEYIVGVGGQIGLELDFAAENRIPLLLSLDFRPMGQLGMSKIKTTGYIGYGVGLSLRYVIN